MFKRFPIYKFVLAGCDYILLLSAWAAAICIRFHDVTWSDLLSRPLVRTQGALILLYSVVWIVVFQHFSLYKLNVFMAAGEQLIAILKSLMYGLVGLVIITFIFRRLDFVDSRLVIAIFAVMGVGLVGGFRVLVFRHVFALASKKKIVRRRVLVIGRDRTAKMVAAQITLDKSHGFELVGFVNDDAIAGERIFENVRNLGSLADLQTLVQDEKIDEIIIAESEVTHQSLLEIIDLAQSTNAGVRLVSELYSIIPEKVLVEKYLGIPIVRMPQNYENTLLSTYKRVFDVLFTIAVSVVLLIPFLLIAVLIKVTSRGPVLYKHTRIGRNCEPFEFYKLRTMYIDSDDTIHREFVSDFIQSRSGNPQGVRKITNDPRVTPFGRILRKTSIDELPQLFNVLKGDMSIVGPRPCMPYELEHYEEWHRRRLSVTPGCTGLWQVAGRSAVDFNDMVILDLFYIDNMSPLFDLRIIFRTLPVMLLARGGH